MFGNNNQDHQATDAPSDDQAQVFTPQPAEPTTAPAMDAADAPTSLPAVGGAAPTDDTAALDDLAAQLTTSTAPEAPAETPAAVEPAAPSARTDTSSDELLVIKQHALQQLTPLVGHLEQSPEDRFKTFMMMIQASDDKSLISNAYTAAQDIADEKVKAQALLDIVNEINYFTQQQQN